MTYQANVYRIFLASPSDVTEERSLFPTILDEWNALHSSHEGAVLLPIKWETHSTPEMGDRPQAIINRQIVSDSDILVGVFWTKLGTPTGVAESGSAEEVEEFRAQKKPVLLYFSNAPVVADSINVDQYKRLKEYRDRIMGGGLVATYDSVSEFRELLLRHLLETVRRLQGKRASETPVEDSAKETPAIEKHLRVDLEYSKTRDYYDLKEYKLKVNLINEGSETISNYRLDIEFPLAFLNPSTSYALEKTDRSTETHKFFRVTNEHQRNEPIHQGDMRTIFAVDYFTNQQTVKTLANTQKLKISVFENDEQIKTIEMPLRDLLDAEGWQRKRF